MRNIGRVLHHQTMFVAETKTDSGGFLSKCWSSTSHPGRGVQSTEKGSGNGVLGKESSLPSASPHPSGWEKSPGWVIVDNKNDNNNYNNYYGEFIFFTWWPWFTWVQKRPKRGDQPLWTSPEIDWGKLNEPIPKFIPLFFSRYGVSWQKVAGQYLRNSPIWWQYILNL